MRLILLSTSQFGATHIIDRIRDDLRTRYGDKSVITIDQAASLHELTDVIILVVEPSAASFGVSNPMTDLVGFWVVAPAVEGDCEVIMTQAPASVDLTAGPDLHCRRHSAAASRLTSVLVPTFMVFGPVPAFRIA